MSIFEFDSYKKFIEKWLLTQPKKGHGCYVKFAEALGISAVMVTQIFSGDKNLSLEHAYLLTEFLDLSANEKDYFLLLVSYERAGSKKLRDYFYKEIQRIQKDRLENLKTVVAQDITLTEADKAIFYSHWLYSAIRLQTSIDGYQKPEQLAEHFDITREEVMDKLEFLVAKNLCVLTRDGYQMGPQRTHLEAGSPYIKQRQISWRVKGFEKMDTSAKPAQLFYTAPMSISESQYAELRKRLTEVIAELNSKITKTKPEKLACLNIDLFEV